MLKRALYIYCILFCFATHAIAQCPDFFNSQGVSSSNPYWVGCSGGTYTIFVQSSIAITGGYTIAWGDGTANSTGASLSTSGFVSHTYAAAVDTFDVVITTTSPACTINGVVVMEQTPSASIQIPFGSPISGCTPASFSFQNASTNVSKTTKFNWSFGDGSTDVVFDYTNSGQTLAHTYLPGVSGCNLAVTLKAENYCNKGNPSSNVYQPLQVWDKDDVKITPDALIKCSPSTSFHFNNTTILNCSSLGNSQQRYEYWNFGDYWGLGHDSIIDWQPFSPPNRAGYDINYPGLGTYNVTLIDSSYCGIKQTTISVQIITPPTAGFSLSADSVCQGSVLTLTNSSTPNANQFTWDFGDGSGAYTVYDFSSQTHTYTTPGNYTVSLVANISGATGCASTLTKSVNVKPTPVANFTLTANNFCDSAIETFTNTSTGLISTYHWTFGNGDTSVLQTPLPVNYHSSGNYTVTLTVTGTNSCGANATSPVNVYQSPNAGISPFTACVNTSGTFNDISTTAPGDFLTSWNWDFGDLTASANAQNPSHTYADTGNFKVRLTVTTTFCQNTDSILARVNPFPVANYTQDSLIGCTPLNVNFTNTSTGGITYAWTFGDGASSASDTTVLHTFVNPSVNDTTYHILLTASAATGCSTTHTTDVTVYHSAHAAFTTDYVVNCSPLPIQFTDASIGATGYSWNFGDGSTSTLQNPSHPFVNNSLFIKTDTTVLTISSANGCTSTVTQSFLIYPAPNFSFVGVPSDTGCTPLNISFVASSGGAMYQWDFGDGASSLTQSPTHTFLTNGNADSIYQVTLICTSPFWCKDTNSFDILVHPTPIASYTSSLNAGCSPLTVSFTDQSTMANTSTWNFGDGNTSAATSPSHTFVNNTNATITYNVSLVVTTANGCTDTMIQQMDVYPEVTAAFPAIASACSPFTISTTNNSINANTYNWDFGDGASSTQATPLHTYTNATVADLNYTITLIAQAATGCADTATAPITVYYKPIANYSVVSDTGCSPFAVTFNDLSSGGIANDWVFGDGSVLNGIASPLHTYLNLTGATITDNVRLIVSSSNACTDTLTSTITIYPQVVANFIGQMSGCSPLTLSLINQSGNANNYNWDFGDGSTSSQVNPTYTYINNSTTNNNLNVTLIASSNAACSDTVQKAIAVFYKPQAAFTTNVSTGCHPLSINFTDQSIGAMHYFWDFGDLSSIDTAANPSHVFTNTTSIPITYTVKLVTTTNDGCVDTVVHSILVNPKVTATFTGNTSGCSPLNVTLTNQSINASIYNWDFGDGNTSTQPTPSNTYTNSTSTNQTYTIQLIASSSAGCADTVNTLVNVIARPVAAFTASPVSQTFPSSTVSVVNTTSAGNWNYTWSWDDGSTSILQNPTPHSYSTWGTYLITMIAESSGCADTAVNTIVIIPPLPTAAFTITPYLGCQPDKICFVNNSQYAVVSLWGFGDGNTSNTTNPCYTYFSDGTFTVTLVVTGPGGDTDTASNTIVINPKPIANFTADPAVVHIPNVAAQFINLSTQATSYLWNFGDGNTSTATNPSYYYNQVGLFDITLIATNQFNCSDTLIRPQFIKAELVSDLVIPNAFTPSATGSTSGAYNSGSYDNDVFFPYVINGITDYHLQIFNRWGEQLFESTDLKIGWDGYYKGVLCMPDVYVWKIEGVYLDGTVYKKAGDLTLLR